MSLQQVIEIQRLKSEVVTLTTLLEEACSYIGKVQGGVENPAVALALKDWYQSTKIAREVLAEPITISPGLLIFPGQEFKHKHTGNKGRISKVAIDKQDDRFVSITFYSGLQKKEITRTTMKCDLKWKAKKQRWTCSI